MKTRKQIIATLAAGVFLMSTSVLTFAEEQVTNPDEAVSITVTSMELKEDESEDIYTDRILMDITNEKGEIIGQTRSAVPDQIGTSPDLTDEELMFTTQVMDESVEDEEMRIISVQESETIEEEFQTISIEEVGFFQKIINFFKNLFKF